MFEKFPENPLHPGFKSLLQPICSFVPPPDLVLEQSPVCGLDLQHQCCLETCQQCRFSGAIQTLNQKLGGETQQSVFTKPPTCVCCSSFREALYQAMFEFMLTQSQMPVSAHCLAFEPPSGSPGNPSPRVSDPSSLKSVFHSLCTSWFLLLVSSGVCTSVSVRLWEKWPRPEQASTAAGGSNVFRRGRGAVFMSD